MKTIVGVGGAAVVALLAAGIMTGEPMTDAVEWRSISDALVEAPKNDKKILLDVYTDWCGWCKRMDKDTYADAEVAAYLKEHYVSSKMNPEKAGKVTYEGKEYSQGEFGAALGIRGYPATAFFNEKNELLTVVPGYMKPKDFLKVLKYFGEDHYLSMTFEEFGKANQ